MKSDYTCKHCGKVFRVHGNQMPWDMNRHYQNAHPKEYADMEERTKKLADDKRKLMEEYPDAVCASFI
jgi:uncharacterized Zn-finger protein